MSQEAEESGSSRGFGSVQSDDDEYTYDEETPLSTPSTTRDSWAAMESATATTASQLRRIEFPPTALDTTTTTTTTTRVVA